jgi:hypothetical protein
MSFTPAEWSAYSRNENVRRRIHEFFGGPIRREHTAVFLAVGTEGGSRYRDPLPLEELTSWLDRGAELNRSLWDRDALVCHLDVEYVNFDDPAYPFANPERVFALQAPVMAAAESLCFVEHCQENLLRFRSSLLDRRKYERLSCGPVNRLFLPEEHS